MHFHIIKYLGQLYFLLKVESPTLIRSHLGLFSMHPFYYNNNLSEGVGQSSQVFWYLNVNLAPPQPHAWIPSTLHNLFPLIPQEKAEHPPFILYSQTPSCSGSPSSSPSLPSDAHIKDTYSGSLLKMWPYQHFYPPS